MTTSEHRASRRRRLTVVGAAAVLAAGSAAVFGAPTTAQVDPVDPVDPAPLSVDPANSDPLGSSHGRPSISADGTVIVFDVVPAADGAADPGDPADPPQPADGASRVVVADRVAGTTTELAGQIVATDPSSTATAAPAVSGDGCRVAFSALLPAPSGSPGSPAPSGPTVELRVVDRCATSPLATVIDTIEAPGRFAVPALSADGAVVAWSTGDEVRRYELDPVSGTWTLTDRIDATPPSAGATDPTSPDAVTAAGLALSADGATLAFAAGPGGVAYEPTPPNVFVWSLDQGNPLIELASMTADGAPGTGASTSPSLSADGQLLVFESSSTDLAAVGGGNATAPFVVMLDRGQGTGVLAADATTPVISPDGRHVVHTRADTLVRTSWESGTPYAVTSVADVAPVVPTGPSDVSQHGRFVVFPSDDGPALTDDTRFAVGEHVWIADLRPGPTVPDVTTSSTTTTSTTSTTTTTTTGPTTTGPTTTGPNDTTTTTPTTTPTTITTTSDPGPVGSEAPVAPTTPPQVTVPIGTLPPDFRFPPLRLPTRPSFPSSSTGSTGSTGSGSFSGSSSSSGSFEVSEPPPTFDVTEVPFPDTIAAAGRSVSTATLRNPGGDPVVVSLLRVEPAGATPFAIASDTCTATTLPATGTCTVEIEFRPDAIGTATATLIADTDAPAGAVAVTLTGNGVGPPALDVVPEVAMPGQVVTVFGSGFPAGVTVDLTWGLGTSAVHAEAQSDPVMADAAGTFAHVVVVLPNTLPGPVPVRVAGQVDLFADVDTELLVSGSRGGASPAVRAGPSVTP